MKTFILIYSLFFSVSLFAQKINENDVNSYKIAFITERLDLTSAEAQAFWPIYNKHHKQYDSLKKNVWEPVKKGLKNIDNLSEEEAEKLLKDYRNYKKMRLQYREDFINELLTVISPKKVMQLKKADYDFNKELLKQYQASK
jgi:hypothetical protein